MTNFNGKTLRLFGVGALTGAALAAGMLSPAAAAPQPAAPTSPSTPAPSKPGTGQSSPNSKGRNGTPKQNGATIHPGAFCGNKGATGRSAAGAGYRCRPDKNGRLRWMK
jgi:hypothetical protein